MISPPQVYGQSNWFLRITHVKCSYQLYKQFFLFFAVFIVLIFGIAMAAFPLDRKTLFLEITIIITAIVLLIIIGVLIFYEVCRKLEEFIPPQVEEPWRYRIEHIEI